MAQAQKQPTARQLAKIDDFYIPADEEDWNDLVSHKAGLRNETIHTIPADWIASASEATEVQSAMIRSYSRPIYPVASFNDKYHQFGFTTEALDTAAGILAASAEWSRYMHLLDTNDSIDDIGETSTMWPGSFSTARRLQEQTITVHGIRDDMQMGQLPDAEDEAIPNAAAIILLQSISQLVHSKLEWVINRVHFGSQFHQTKSTAYTDGALRSKNTIGIFAIVEVKRRMRQVNTDAILTQEACEVAGWSMSCHGQMAHFNEHFLLISQDRHELFITFVPFDKGYEECLSNGQNTDAFLVMRTFGPFDTGSVNDMHEFGRVVLAAILIVMPVA
ncbi:hypothetical protein DTO013E5_3293 [Penicillium roqueforti]|nr:uncharacterized protein LCP9604111_5939 [Penicillium roqueforti]KAF9247749.1 hypothetical protein LCP9604111_5939 [Penicillium roqueforti]KAI1837058.1 hypothetical protein CBS147337_2310 [Penicillium roqueforti]KAI2678114.1 hypothetical protein CBS147355_5115 [Penicillium roqueforti]KAI2704477.1 hypothetical protein CBS147372_2946 [Penicillium roqueforti]KAI2715830.1 hypothetical protein CBS147318_5681 [Penicillium roqueforti]